MMYMYMQMYMHMYMYMYRYRYVYVYIHTYIYIYIMVKCHISYMIYHQNRPSGLHHEKGLFQINGERHLRLEVVMDLLQKKWEKYGKMQESKGKCWETWEYVAFMVDDDDNIYNYL